MAAVTAVTWAAGPSAAGPTDALVSNWAGYVLTGNFHSISAQWIEPEVTCTDTGVIQRVSPWIGLNGSKVDGSVALPLMQTGSEATCVSDAGMLASMPGLTVENFADASGSDPSAFRRMIEVSAGLNTVLGQVVSGGCTAAGTGSASPHSLCAQGTERTVWWEAYPAAPVRYGDVTSAPGDRMTSSVTYDGTAYTMTLSNQTKGWTRRTVQQSSAPALTAEIVVEGQLDNALPAFSPVAFTDIEVDGKPLTEFTPVPYSIAATNGVLAPGPITAGGTAFTVTR